MANINAGAVVWNLDIDDSKFKSKLKSASSAMKDGADKTEKATSKSWLKTGAVMGAVAGAAQAAFSKAMDVISNSVQGAIKRVDILNNFPKVMSNMNISADESKKTINELSKSLQGLPTPLDTAALAVQRLTTSTGDVKKAKDVFLALNNAILAGGAPMDLQSSAMEQFSQAFAKGKPDMIEWRSLMSAMPTQLKQLAEHLKMPNVDALGEALRNGDISMQQFSDALIELNKNGTGQFQSFEKQAKNSTAGVQTGIANMQTAITRGIANIMQSIGQENISKGIAAIGTAFEKTFNLIAKVLKDTDVQIALAITAVGLLVVGLRLLVPAIWEAITPLLPFIAAFAGIVAVVKLVRANWATIEPIVNTVKNAFLLFWEAIKPIRDFIVDQFKKAWDDLKASFESVKKSLEPFLPQLKILGIILGVVLLTPLLIMIATIGVLIAVFVAVTVGISRVIGWLSRLIAWFVNMHITVSRTVAEVAGNISRAFNNAQQWLYDAGRSLVQGLINGIKDMAGAVSRTVSDMGSSIKNKFKGMLGIHSPSKVFAEYGSYMGQGLAKGIDKSKGMVTSAVAGLGQVASSNIGVEAGAIPQVSDMGIESTKTTYVINNELNMSGIMARSRTDLRDIGHDMIQAVNEGLRAKGVAEIGGGAI